MAAMGHRPIAAESDDPSPQAMPAVRGGPARIQYICGPDDQRGRPDRRETE